jgi:hypothetical protein
VGRRLVAVCTLAVALGLLLTPMAPADAARSDLLSSALAAVSGTIHHDGAPVAGVRVMVFWEGGGEESTTGSDGTYAMSGVPAGSWVMIHVIPPLHMRLASHNLRIDHVTGDVVQDFDLVSGFLLSGQFLLPDGAAYNEGFWLSAQPVDFMIPDGQWLGTTAINGQFEVVLPPGIFMLQAGTYPYSAPRTKFDLRQADQTAVTVTLLREPEPPFPTEPPRAELIIIGPPDADGMANIVGAAGAVEPLSQVILVNLHSNNVGVTTSDASGGFRSRVFAPPGSTVLVKYDPKGQRVVAGLSGWTGPTRSLLCQSAARHQHTRWRHP